MTNSNKDYSKIMAEKYTFTVTISHGNDEWWEEIAKLPNKKLRINEVKKGLLIELQNYNVQIK